MIRFHRGFFNSLGLVRVVGEPVIKFYPSWGGLVHHQGREVQVELLNATRRMVRWSNLYDVPKKQLKNVPAHWREELDGPTR